MKKQFTLIGEKLSHSFSPQIHKIILNYIEIEGSYDLSEIPMGQLNTQLPEIIKNHHGLNVTIPYKRDAMEFVNDIDDISKEIGAINTIKNANGERTGYNTDYFGFGATLEKYEVIIKNTKAYILGTGGASKAVYYYLRNHEIGEITFVSRNKDTHWAKDCKILSYDECKRESGHLVINCTPLGMSSLANKSPLEKSVIANFDCAIDLIYNPQETLFLQYARELGLQSINGLYMLVGQAVKSQEIWNDMTIGKGIIDKIYTEIKEMMFPC